MRSIRLGFLGLFVTLGVVASPAHAARVKLTVLGIEAVDEGDQASQEKTAAAAKHLTDALRARVTAARARFETLPNANRELSEVKLVSGCLDEARDCMVTIGKQLGAERLIYGKLDRKGSNYVLTLRLLNVTGRQIEKTLKNYPVPAAQTNVDGAKQIATELFTQLTGVSITTATVVVRANVQTGTAKVTGGGSAPIVQGVATIEGVPEGPAEVVVESDGYEATTQQIDVAGPDLRVEVTLPKVAEAVVPPTPVGPEPDETPARRPGSTYRTFFWVSLGATAIGGATWLWSWQKIKSAESSIDDVKADWVVESGNGGMDACALAQLPGEASDPQAGRVRSACDDGASYQTINRFVGVPLTLVGVAASAFFLYKGYLSTDAKSGEASAEVEARRRRDRRFVLAPELYPEGGAGASAVLVW